ncbi:MAG TPA: 2-oxoglutarate dehydrogenase complex dihydrolipoyllysine-residue succinyltransferase [Phycisphaerales bacterium]|nr:2-oxoglutarate dehydrogenase complex dihydrolipoyllysine-residue succinyltransferase [Phycisphaerales bacterium]HMP36073.1 2-oxoglutarate dehydrogenase complex dihydrolipoyllysine-residue succinyltransferase [Phycisphaerales bacterium]
MSTQLTIPSPGESISEVRLGTWHKQDGDWVEKDELLVEIESDKATLELRAPAAGRLGVKAATGSDLPVGAVVGEIDTASKRPAAAATSGPAVGGATTASATAIAGAASGTTASGSPSSAASGSGEPRATSVARKIAAERGVDLASVQGTGPSGRITREDVESVARQPAGDAAARSAGSASLPSSAAPGGGAATVPGAVHASRGVRRERMTKLRLRIAERLVEAQRTAAMLTTFNEADMTEVMRLRAEHKEAFEKRHGIGLGFMSFFVAACASALRAFPKANASIVGEEVEYHDHADIAVAVGTDKGLVVPVLRNAESRSFAQIEQGIKELALRARDGKLAVEEMTGGTFTISNGGVYGSLMSTPILNPPQSAILGMHSIKRRPVEDPANPGQIVLRPMMYLALSYDHRILDGAEAVGFLVHVRNCVERPERLLLGL